MIFDIAQGILLPFLGTSLGAACVFFLRGELRESVRGALAGFAAGVMTAASVWSLLLPAMEQTGFLGRWSFVPAAAGFWAGVLLLAVLDRLARRLSGAEKAIPPRTSLMILAVVLHNVPEGMAVGVVYAGYLAGQSGITAAGALALALGVAIQNFPEGAIVSLPMRAEGVPRGRAFGLGVLSGAVEPAGALLVLLAARILTAALPVFLGFAAGAMLCVVVEELVPEMHSGASRAGSLWFSAGFVLMMALDCALS